jgi:hypothetical protein
MRILLDTHIPFGRSGGADRRLPAYSDLVRQVGAA